MNIKLTSEQKRILLNKGTEPAFSGELLLERRAGIYMCANCGTELFSSEAKYESGSGWPSFTEPSNRNHVSLAADTSHGMVRTEVACAHCGGHLGHVFDDGPADKGGQRFCVNSLSLEFEPGEK